VLICGLLGRQPVCNISYKPSTRLSLLLPGLWLPSQLQCITALGRYQCVLLGEQENVPVTCLQSMCHYRMAGDRTSDLWIASPMTYTVSTVPPCHRIFF